MSKAMYILQVFPEAFISLSRSMGTLKWRHGAALTVFEVEWDHLGWVRTRGRKFCMISKSGSGNISFCMLRIMINPQSINSSRLATPYPFNSFLPPLLSLRWWQCLLTAFKAISRAFWRKEMLLFQALKSALKSCMQCSRFQFERWWE